MAPEKPLRFGEFHHRHRTTSHLLRHVHVALRRRRDGRGRPAHASQCRSRSSQRLHLRQRRRRAGDRLFARSPAISAWCARAPKAMPTPVGCEITWEQALNLVALTARPISKIITAPKPWSFRAPPPPAARPSTSTAGCSVLANAFGSPNLLTSNHICTWNRRVGSQIHLRQRHAAARLRQYPMHAASGASIHRPPRRRKPCASTARSNRGAKLIVIDPRKTTLAAKADCWLRVRPGKDGELAMAMIHVLSRRKSFRRGFRAQTGPTARSWFAPITINC